MTEDNKYLIKVSKLVGFKVNTMRKPSLSSLKSPGGRDTLSQLRKIEKNLEQTTRMKSLRETTSDAARKSFAQSRAKGSGDAAGKAISKMQDYSGYPLTGTNVTKQRLKK